MVKRNMPHHVPFFERKDKVVLLEESRAMIGLSIQEFANAFIVLRKCDRGYIQFKKANFEVVISVYNSLRACCSNQPESCEFELETSTRDMEENASFRCKLSMVDLASYFDRRKTCDQDEPDISSHGVGEERSRIGD